MSRAGYADFFPAAPSVLAKKAQQAEREKARQAHDQPKCISGVVPAGFLSINNPKAPPPNSANLVPANLLNQKLTPRTSGPSPPTLQSPSRTKHDSLSQKAIPRGDPPHSALLTPKATPPAVKPDSALKNWRVKYDPALEKKGAPVKSKHTIVRWDGEGITTPVTDPRAAIPNYLKGPTSGKKRLRSQGLYRTRWQWDENYVGPGPPSQILITGLSLLATEHDVQMHFRPCGEVQQVEIKVDPSTGGSLGLCSINYRDHKVNKTPAHEAARKAVQKCNGVAIRMEKVTVELDRDGLKCQKLMERILRRKREEERRKEQEALKNRPPPPPPPPPRASQPDRDSGSTRRRESSPRREARSPTRGSKQNCYDTVEDIKKKIGRKPYIFIDKASIPGEERYTPHLFGRLKNFGLHEIIRDTSGFFVVFNDAWNMQRCFRMCDGDRLFSFTMNMHMHLEGVRCTRIPGRSPSPSPKSHTREMKVESKRARDIDPVTEATNGLIKEMKAALLKDVKKRIAAPTLYDFLEPSRHIKKQKLGELEPEAVAGLEGHHVDHLSSAQVSAIKANNLPPIATSIPQVNSLGTPTPTAPSFPKLETLSPKPITAKPGALPRFKKRTVVRRQDTPTSESIPKLNIVSKKPVIANARPLAHQLNRYHSDVGSDDESTNTGDRPTSRGDSMSRAMSTDTESIAPSIIDRNLKRKRSSVGPTSRLRDAAMSTDDEEEVRPVAIITAQADKKSRPERVKSDLCDEIADLAAFICESGDEEVRNGITTNKKGLKQKKGKKRSRDLDFTSSDESEKDVPLARKKKKLTPDDDEDEDDDMHESIERPTATESESEAFRRKPKNAKARVAGKPASTLRKSVGVNDAEEENKDISWETSATGGPIATVQDDDNTILDLEGMQHLVKDSEDFEFLRLALEGVKNADMGNIFAWAYKQKELKAANGGANRSPEKIEGFFRPNPSGCARTEGYRRIPEAEKSMYLPHRLLLASKKSAAAQTPSTQPASAPNATSKPSKNAGVTSRSNRVNNRRLVAELNNQKILLSSDADVIRFNQLKKRKKPVKFARSAIHNWGLYAMENIAANDMIIEYVGEIVRQQVADMREKKYLKSGIGSSYLFRIDDVTVIDATKRGGIARFINHSCTPNCTAKIIKVEGSKRIVIYALRDIRENEELTYDYKFERELDSEERIPCLCGSSGCKGFLN